MKPYSLTAITAAPRAVEWIKKSHSARLLNIFNQVINLVNEHDQVLSITTPAIGNGPFTLLVGGRGFQEVVSARSSVVLERETIRIGDLKVDCSQLEIWDPRPNWIPLTQSQHHTLRQNIRERLSAADVDSNFPGLLASAESAVNDGISFADAASQAVEQIRIGFQEGKRASILMGSAALAGLGIGLTPAGDDFLVGMMHGLWIRAADLAQKLCLEIARTASPRTSTLSAAWLEAASDGEATQAWHTFIRTIYDDSAESMEAALDQILRTGQTSGADALTGFLFILNQEQIL
jgi:hypothetical protein